MPPPFRRLPLRFDAAALKADLAHLAEADWTVHFNTPYHDGGWTGIGLRAVGGDARVLYAAPEAECRDTALLAACPHIAGALAQFRCRLDSVRLLRLAAGGTIREHCDDRLGLAHGAARLHIPLATNPEVEFYLDGVRVRMEAGECWYLDLSLPHRVQNLGTSERIHLVLDCAVDDWLLALIESGDSGPAEPAPESSQDRLGRFCRQVLGDEALQLQLRDLLEPADFIGAVVALGREHGHRFTREDVRAAMQANRRAHPGRWTVR